MSDIESYHYNSLKTFYHGETFDSRTEAVWARFMFENDIEYRREKRNFKLLSGTYRPDFWLPESFMWLEVKPCWEVLKKNDYSRYQELAQSRAECKGFLLGIGYPVCDMRLFDLNDLKWKHFFHWSRKKPPFNIHFFVTEQQWKDNFLLPLEHETIGEWNERMLP